jgi:Flp pilus assembly protein TadG
MKIHRPAARNRGGATTVEFAFIAILLFLMLFGIIEYGRFLFVYHLATNAARDGARFAAVKTAGGTMTGEPAVITTDDVKEVVRTGMFNGRAYGTGMCGMEGQITGYTCDVYAIPSAQMYSNPPNTDPAGKPAWNSAPFHEKIAVRISGTYKPVLPNLLRMGSDVDFKVLVMMSSEAN